MKISFTTLSCPDWSWDKILDEASRLGYDGIEVRGADGEMFLPKAKPFLPENLEDTIKKVKEKGLSIAGLGSSVKFDNPERYDDALAEGKAYVDLAQSLGVKYVRIFGDKIHDPQKKDETIELVSKGFKELCDYCEGKDVYLLFETHGDFTNLDTVLPVMEKVNSPYLYILWDIEHTFKYYGKDVSEFFEKTWKYIKHTHIKDTKKVGNEFQLTGIGEGDVPIGDIIGMLKEKGYDGYLSLEWEKKWRPHLAEPEEVIPKYIDYIKKFL